MGGLRRARCNGKNFVRSRHHTRTNAHQRSLELEGEAGWALGGGRGRAICEDAREGAGVPQLSWEGGAGWAGSALSPCGGGAESLPPRGDVRAVVALLVADHEGQLHGRKQLPAQRHHDGWTFDPRERRARSGKPAHAGGANEARKGFGACSPSTRTAQPAWGAAPHAQPASGGLQEAMARLRPSARREMLS